MTKTSAAVVQAGRRCSVSVTTEAQFISSSSDVNSVSSCGSKSHPWRLEAAAGQRINISLLDFTASVSASRDRFTCRQYGYVLEKLNKRNVSVCAGGGAQLRQTHVLLSQSNDLHIVQTPSSEQKFLIKVEGRFILFLFTVFACLIVNIVSQWYLNIHWIMHVWMFLWYRWNFFLANLCFTYSHISIFASIHFSGWMYEHDTAWERVVETF